MIDKNIPSTFEEIKEFVEELARQKSRAPETSAAPFDLTDEGIPTLLIELEKAVEKERRAKGRVSPELSTQLEEMKILNEFSPLFEENNPLSIRYDPVLKKKFLAKKIALLRHLNKEQLLEKLAELQIEAESNEFIYKIDKKASVSLFNLMEESHKKKIKNSANKTEGRARLYKENKIILEKVFEEFELNLLRPPSIEDYKDFENLILNSYPNPSYIPQPRISQRKKLTTKQLDEELEDLKREDWAKSSIYDFYKCKINSKKDSSLK